jgi:DNA-binding Xre family transcriptional regulator
MADILFEVPSDLHAQLTQRAASAGLSLSAYLLRELQRRSGFPTPEEFGAGLLRQGLPGGGALLPSLPLVVARSSPEHSKHDAPSINARERQTLEMIIPVVVGALREYRGMTQAELAAAMGWTRNQVANLECSRKPLEFADYPRLCRVLRIAPERLLRLITQWLLLAGDPSS